MRKRSGEPGQRPLRVFVLDCEALSLAVRGDRKMIAWLDLAARGEAEVVASPMTLARRTTAEPPSSVGTGCFPGSKSPTSGRTRPAGPAACWRTPSCTVTSTRSTRYSPSSRASSKGRSPSSPRTWTTWRGWSRSRSSSRRYDPALRSQFRSHSSLSSAVHHPSDARLRSRSEQPRPTPNRRTNMWKAWRGQPLTKSHLVSSAVALTGQCAEGPPFAVGPFGVRGLICSLHETLRSPPRRCRQACSEPSCTDGEEVLAEGSVTRDSKHSRSPSADAGRKQARTVLPTVTSVIPV